MNIRNSACYLIGGLYFLLFSAACVCSPPGAVTGKDPVVAPTQQGQEASAPAGDETIVDEGATEFVSEEGTVIDEGTTVEVSSEEGTVIDESPVVYEDVSADSMRYPAPGNGRPISSFEYKKADTPRTGIGPAMTTSLPANLPIEHVWEYFKRFGDEPKNYATYSYVLAGRDGGDKYAKLVNSIQNSTPSAAKMAESKNIQPEELNIFLIPAINTDGSAYKPDYEMSKSLLAVVDARSKLNFDRPGPYIITLYQPISRLQKNNPVVDMLYVDLTNISKGAIAELVRTYKQTVLNDKLNGLNKLSSLRLSILNLAFMTEESIGFAKTASASLYPIFSGGNQ